MCGPSCYIIAWLGLRRASLRASTYLEVVDSKDLAVACSVMWKRDCKSECAISYRTPQALSLRAHKPVSGQDILQLTEHEPFLGHLLSIHHSEALPVSGRCGCHARMVAIASAGAGFMHCLRQSKSPARLGHHLHLCRNRWQDALRTEAKSCLCTSTAL